MEEIGGTVFVPIEAVTLVDSDESFGRNSQKLGLHPQKVIPDRISHAYDAIDPWIEKPHPGDRAKETHVSDDSSIGHDMDRKPSGCC